MSSFGNAILGAVQALKTEGQTAANGYIPQGYQIASGTTGSQVEDYFKQLADQHQAEQGHDAAWNAGHTEKDFQGWWNDLVNAHPDWSPQQLYSAASQQLVGSSAEYGINAQDINPTGANSIFSQTPPPAPSAPTGPPPPSAAETAATGAVNNDISQMQTINGYLAGGQSAADTTTLQGQQAALRGTESSAASQAGFGASGDSSGNAAAINSQLTNTIQNQQAQDAQAYAAQRQSEYAQWAKQLGTLGTDIQTQSQAGQSADLQQQVDTAQSLYNSLQTQFQGDQQQQQVDIGAAEGVLDKSTDTYTTDIQDANAARAAENSYPWFNFPIAGAFIHGAANIGTTGSPFDDGNDPVSAGGHLGYTGS